jgi:hypothetical protein
MKTKGNIDLRKVVVGAALKKEHAGALLLIPLAKLAGAAKRIRLFDHSDVLKVAKRKDLQKPADRVAFRKQLEGADDDTFAAVLSKVLAGVRVQQSTGSVPRTPAEVYAWYMQGGADSAADVLLPLLFAEPDLATKTGAQLASTALSVLAKAASSQKGFDRAEPRWVRVAVSLEGHPLVGRAAEEAISALDSAAVKKARAARGPAKTWTIPKKKRPSRVRVEEGHLVARYEAGHHDAVWKKLRDLGAGVRHGEALEEATAVARQTIKRFADDLDTIVERLRKSGYVLASPESAVRRAAPDAAKKIAALEKRLGGPLPLALRAFYEVFDSIDLREETEPGTAWDSPFLELGRSDPLVIIPIAQLTVEAKDAGARDGTEAEVYLAPTKAKKFDPDQEEVDDCPLHVVLPDAGADARLRMWGQRERWFVDYLRVAVIGGGFVGVVRDGVILAKHAAVIRRVTRGLAPL